jgi:hypothetical protein
MPPAAMRWRAPQEEGDSAGLPTPDHDAEVIELRRALVFPIPVVPTPTAPAVGASRTSGIPTVAAFAAPAPSHLRPHALAGPSGPHAAPPPPTLALLLLGLGTLRPPALAGPSGPHATQPLPTSAPLLLRPGSTVPSAFLSTSTLLANIPPALHRSATSPFAANASLLASLPQARPTALLQLESALAQPHPPAAARAPEPPASMAVPPVLASAVGKGVSADLAPAATAPSQAPADVAAMTWRGQLAAVAPGAGVHLLASVLLALANLQASSIMAVAGAPRLPQEDDDLVVPDVQVYMPEELTAEDLATSALNVDINRHTFPTEWDDGQGNAWKGLPAHEEGIAPSGLSNLLRECGLMLMGLRQVQKPRQRQVVQSQCQSRNVCPRQRGRRG